MHPLILFHTANTLRNTGGDFPWIVAEQSNPYSSEGMKAIIEAANQTYFLICTSPSLPEPGAYALERMVQVANDTGAVLLYSDYNKRENNTLKTHTLNDYQIGSLRDDFDFGPLILVRTATAKALLKELMPHLQSAAFYDLRLALSRRGPIVHLNERLYTQNETRTSDLETKQFAYVDPKNRNTQLEMEAVCTQHLKAIGAWLPPSTMVPISNRDRFR